MFLLIPKVLGTSATIESFKFHYVSINSALLQYPKKILHSLNSIMFLLILYPHTFTTQI